MNALAVSGMTVRKLASRARQDMRVGLLRGLRALSSAASATTGQGEHPRRIVVESAFGKDLPKQHRTLIDYVWKDSCVWEDKKMITCGATAASYTYREGRRLTHGFARALAGRAEQGEGLLGLSKGEVVAIVAPNIPEFVFAAHGAIEAGLVVTFVNPLYTPEETGRQLRLCNARLVVTVPALVPLVRAVAKGLPQYRATVLLTSDEQGTDGGHAGELNFRALAEEGLSTEGVELPQLRGDDVAILPFSSGTTGMPKGVMLTHDQLVSNVVMKMHPDFRFALYTKGPVQDSILSVLPFFHIYGFNSTLHTTMLSGQHLITLPRFTPEAFIACLVRHRPTGLSAVPAVLQFLASHPAVLREHLASVRYVICGAAPLGLDVLHRLNDKAGRELDVRQGYGMTETAPVTTLCSKGTPLHKRGSVGQLLPGTRARVVDLTTGADLGPGQPGELLIKGPQVMKGYFNDEEATREVLDADGWLHTGDVAYYDQENYFYIVDRTKELIKVKGHQVSPTELERVIRQLPAVADVAVVGVADEKNGEVPLAFIVLQPEAKLSESEVVSFVEPKVAPFKRLKGGVRFIDTIPRNAGGKVLRNQLKIMAQK